MNVQIIILVLLLSFMPCGFIYTKRRKIRVARFSQTQYTLHDLRRFLRTEHTMTFVLLFFLFALEIYDETSPNDIGMILKVDRKIHSAQRVYAPEIQSELGQKLWNMYATAFYAEYSVPVELYFNA